MTETTRYPLAWPAGWKRTPAGDRQRADFRRVVKAWDNEKLKTVRTGNRPLTVNDTDGVATVDVTHHHCSPQDVFVPAPLVIEIPGQIRNPLNTTLSLWKHRRLVKAWRERTAEAVRVALLTQPGWRGVDPATPKLVTLHAVVGKRFDPTNLPACFKPVIDGLVDARVLHQDGPSCGHAFAFEQTGTRKDGPRVRITIVPQAAPR